MCTRAAGQQRLMLLREEKMGLACTPTGNQRSNPNILVMNVTVNTVGSILFFIGLAIALYLGIGLCCICPTRYMRNDKKLPENVNEDDILWVNVP